MEQDIIHIESAGMGTNTIAQLILLTKQGIKLDYILFSNTKGERLKTYKYIPIMNKWLVANGQPKIKTLKQLNKDKKFIGLYDDVFQRKSLPSIVFGHKSCSLKFKKNPFDVFVNNNQDIQNRLKNGAIIHKHIGFDIDESHRMTKDFDTDKMINVYDLVIAEMGRFECEKLIRDMGLPLPGKSSCFYCSSLKPHEVIDLYETEPKNFFKAIDLERNSKDTMTAIKGLGRDFSWWDLIVAYRYLKLVKRHNAMGYVPDKIKKLMLKINRSKPIDYEKLSKERDAKACIITLFSRRIEKPCECMS